MDFIVLQIALFEQLVAESLELSESVNLQQFPVDFKHGIFHLLPSLYLLYSIFGVSHHFSCNDVELECLRPREAAYSSLPPRRIQ